MFSPSMIWRESRHAKRAGKPSQCEGAVPRFEREDDRRMGSERAALVYGGGSGGLRSGGGKNADEAAAAALVLEFDEAGDEGEKRVVLALGDVEAGLVARAALADEDGAGVDELAAEALHAEALAVRVAAVCRGAA